MPGTGATPFERLAAFVFGLVYLVPLVGLLHAHFYCDGNIRSAATVPAAYHLMSSMGCLFVFSDALNPALASSLSSATMHFVFFVLFVVLFRIAPSTKTH